MKALARADFHWDVTIDGETRYVIRDVIPKDFYWYALVENDYPDMTPSHRMLQLVSMLLDQDESVLDEIPIHHFKVLTWWLSANVLEEKIMSLDQWYQTAFHLCKQRYDATMEWMEEQPVPKILLMIQTLSQYAKEQEREMRKARRKK